MASGFPWKVEILQRLQNRDRKEFVSFKDLIKSHNKLFDNADTLKSKIVQLEIQTLHMKQENAELQDKTSKTSSSGTVGSEKVQALEHKIDKLKEELIGLHRTKGENAQKVIELNNMITQKNEDLSLKEAQLQDSLINLDSVKTEAKRLEQTIMELEATNQMLKDELQALQMAYNSLEIKFAKTQEENRELVERWMVKKAKDADAMNLENEQMTRARQAKLRHDLMEAAKEPVALPPKKRTSSSSLDHNGDHDIPAPPYCFFTSLPTEPLHKVVAHDGEVNAVAFSPNGRYFATGGSDKLVKIWEIGKTCDTKSTIHGCNAGVTSVEFDMQDKLLLASSNDYACRIWTYSDGRLRHTLTGHTNKVSSAKFLLDSTKVVSGSHDRTLKVWDLRTKACNRTIFAGSSCNDVVTTSLASTTIISGHFDKRIRFWDSRSDTSSTEIGLPGRVTSLCISPDRNTLLAATRGDALKLINLRMNQVSGTLSANGLKIATDCTRACFSPDGSYVSCGSQDGSIFIWDTTTLKPEKVLKCQGTAVVTCAWHPEGNALVSCDRNKQVIVWSSLI
ncbi:autophagy-related protein 16-1-like [Dendronephthya gigantea]|uniref:autophagy-related protein 16-1-like n=1 Tax=Dendronephthya gigantea TaxID=151771 RepID=UPI00106C936E|nr:autophagy-related protein 16-1-like [Dendronephthya gigantea]